VQLIRLLERDAMSHFHAAAASRLPTDRFGDFFKLRHERWADEYSSPIMDSLVDGHLQRVAERLATDDSLQGSR
jgi:hypothetical protein